MVGLLIITVSWWETHPPGYLRFLWRANHPQQQKVGLNMFSTKVFICSCQTVWLYWSSGWSFWMFLTIAVPHTRPAQSSCLRAPYPRSHWGASRPAQWAVTSTQPPSSSAPELPQSEWPDQELESGLCSEAWSSDMPGTAWARVLHRINVALTKLQQENDLLN